MLIHFISSDKRNYLLVVQQKMVVQGLSTHDCAEKPTIVQAVTATQVMHILSNTDQKPLIRYWIITTLDNYHARMQISHQEKSSVIHYHS